MSNKFHFITLSSDLTPRQNSLYLFTSKKYNLNFYYPRKRNIGLKLIDLFIILIKLRFKKDLSKKFIVGNNSIFITLLVRALFPKSIIIKDIGYFVNDIKNLNFLRKIIYWISDLSSLFTSDMILFETFAQMERYSKNSLISIFKKKYRVFYAIEGEIKKEENKQKSAIKNKFKFLNQNKSINILEDDYLLFRGKFNYESGVDLLANIYSSLNHTKFKKMPIVFLGNGPLMEKLLINLKKLQAGRVVLITDYLSINNLNLLISNANLLFGQFNNDSLRLKYTLPNKFYEAMINNRPYITPNYSSFKYLSRLGIINIFNRENFLSEKFDADLKKLFFNFLENANLFLNQPEEIVLIESNGDFFKNIQNLNERNLQI